jgi:hypothetical protein
MTRKEMFDAIRLLPLEGKAFQRELAGPPPKWVLEGRDK